MDFVHYDLGHLSGGEAVVVALDAAANVHLLDTQGFDNYRAGRQYSYYGGYVTESPYRTDVPHAGHWHLTIDLGGHPGRLRSTVSVIPT